MFFFSAVDLDSFYSAGCLCRHFDGNSSRRQHFEYMLLQFYGTQASALHLLLDLYKSFLRILL